MKVVGRLEGKYALITGGSRGIGKSIAAHFRAEGARLIVVDRLEELGRAFVAELGPPATFRLMDVTDEQAWRLLASDLTDDPVDVLVNNAGGLQVPKQLHEMEPIEWRREIELNLTSVFFGMRFMIPIMLRGHGGSVINIASMSGVAGQCDAAGYQAAKGGVRLLTKNGAVTYASRGIRVNAINPGVIATEVVRAQPNQRVQLFIDATPMGRMGLPQDVSQAAVFLASDESAFVTGAEINVDGGYLA